MAEDNIVLLVTNLGENTFAPEIGHLFEQIGEVFVVSFPFIFVSKPLL